MTLIPANIELMRGEPRVRDLQLAEALGFERPRKIRDLILRNEAELSGYSEVCTSAGRTSFRGGRPSTEYWLAEPQALLICMFARTGNAAIVRKQVIDVFMAWRRGQTHPGSMTTDTLFAELVARGYGQWRIVFPCCHY